MVAAKFMSKTFSSSDSLKPTRAIFRFPATIVAYALWLLISYKSLNARKFNFPNAFWSLMAANQKTIIFARQTIIEFYLH